MSKGYVWPLGHFEIYAARADGTGLVKLTDTKAYNAEATVSPDGKRIIFTSTRDGDIDLYTMNIDGSDVRRITSRVGYDGGAFYSPDGRQIVWRARIPPRLGQRGYRGLLPSVSAGGAGSGWPTPTAVRPDRSRISAAPISPRSSRTTGSRSSSARITSTRRGGTSTSS
jgi:Tol biopolymer transport system component